MENFDIKKLDRFKEIPKELERLELDFKAGKISREDYESKVRKIIAEPMALVSQALTDVLRTQPKQRQIEENISKSEMPARSKELLKKIYPQLLSENKSPIAWGGLSGYKIKSVSRCPKCGDFAIADVCFKCNRPVESKTITEVPFGDWEGSLTINAKMSDREEWRWSLELKMSVSRQGISGKAHAAFMPIKFEDGCRYNHRCKVEYPSAEEVEVAYGPSACSITICLPMFVCTDQTYKTFKSRGSSENRCVGCRSIFVLGTPGKPLPPPYLSIYGGYPFLIESSESTDGVEKAVSKLNKKIQRLIREIVVRRGSGPDIEYDGNKAKTAGTYFDGAITLYAGSSGNKPGVVIHEAGHAVYDNLLGDKLRGEWVKEIWYNTKNLSYENGGPTSYGATHPREDFAESFRGYFEDEASKGELKLFNRSRYAFLEKFLKDYPEEKLPKLVLRSLLPEKAYKVEGGVLRPSWAPSLKRE